MLGVPALAHRPCFKAKEQTTPLLNEYLAGTTAVMKAHVEEGWIYLCICQADTVQCQADIAQCQLQIDEEHARNQQLVEKTTGVL